MEAAVVQIKKEKIDPEIEQKIKGLLDVQVKKESLNDINPNAKAEESSDSNSSTDSNVEEEPEDKKNVELVKTSNELLAELFQVFNAAPPEELLNDDDLLKKAKEKSKKSKKAKKKKHKRHKSEDASDTDKKDKHKHKKKKKHKHKEEEKKSDRSKSTERDKSKSEKSARKSKDREPKKPSEEKELKKESKVSPNINIKKERKDFEDNGRKRRLSGDRNAESPTKHHKRSNNALQNGYKQQDERAPKIKTEKIDVGSEQRRRSYRNSRDQPERNEMSDISLSDEETYLRERNRIAESVIPGERQRQHNYESHQRSRNRRPNDRMRRHTRSRSRSPKCSSSHSRDLGIDKKRLLEIARKNAISMFKRGNLPGCANMTEDVKDKVLLQMRYGGRTVQDLTDFCRKISNGEPLSDLSSDNDSDIDKEGNTRAFHHPFQLKEREPIVLQIRNAIPIVPAATKNEDQTKAITMQFPVSSGQQHRISETWIPVVAKPPQTAAPLPFTAATQSMNIFKQTVPRNVFEKNIPVAELQEPAFKPIGATSLTTADVVSSPSNPHLPEIISNIAPPPAISTNKNPLPPPFVPAMATVGKEFVPDVPIPSSTPSDSIFPDANAGAVDVSSIISKRLSALRRLQENPMDSEAIKMMYNSQKEMSSWASSKHIPGQFTGSTGANILKAHELNSGPQVWARRDQLTATKPVTGGMGMHLLQKMGWKPGEGLGREKKGTLHPLLLDVKLDKRGLVAKDDHANVNGAKLVQQLSNKKRQNSVGEVMQTFQNKHPVCILNEITSKRKWTPPLYELVSEGGAAHSKKFLFSVSMNGQTFTPTDGSNSKKEAKLIAAKFCLEQIGILPTMQ